MDARNNVHIACVQAGGCTGGLRQNLRAVVFGVRVAGADHVAAKGQVLQLVLTDRTFHVIDDVTNNTGIRMAIRCEHQIVGILRRTDIHRQPGQQAHDHHERQHQRKDAFRCFFHFQTSIFLMSVHIPWGFPVYFSAAASSPHQIRFARLPEQTIPPLCRSRCRGQGSILFRVPLDNQRPAFTAVTVFS